MEWAGKQSGNEGIAIAVRMFELIPRRARGQASAMIAIDRVRRYFKPPAGKATSRCRTSRCRSREGAFVSILGPSGCGKSTLLYIVGGSSIRRRAKATVKGR